MKKFIGVNETFILLIQTAKTKL